MELDEDSSVDDSLPWDSSILLSKLEDELSELLSLLWDSSILLSKFEDKLSELLDSKVEDEFTDSS